MSAPSSLDTTSDVDAACLAAEAALRRQDTGATFPRDALLDAVAAALDDGREEVLAIAQRESRLPRAALEREHVRTVRQLQAFADLVRTGSEADLVVDPADATALASPRPELRRLAVPVGPVAVFAASNFPLAFGVVGGDTASAWAAGCPVVAKAHPLQTGTAEVLARLVGQAASHIRLDDGWFTLLNDTSLEAGLALVRHPAIAAVGFTGSLVAGRSLMDAAAARPAPIPVYAEMASLNPVFATTGAAARAGFVEGFVSSVTLNGGQLCTKPGLLLVSNLETARTVAERAAELLREVGSAPMLAPRMARGIIEAARALGDAKDVETVLAPDADDAGHCSPALHVATTAALRTTPELIEEHFGPAAVIVAADGYQDLLDVTDALPGSLTASVHATATDADWVRRLLPRLMRLAGRVVHGQWPTGVAVSDATVHGGPYPASSTALHTSVGMPAVRRFQRPVVLQNFPAELLPAQLRDEALRGKPHRWAGTVRGAQPPPVAP